MVGSLILEGDGSAKNPPVVNVKWDGLPYVQGWEKGGEHEQPLKNHLYNKNKDGAWRIDVGIEEVRNIAVDESNEEDTVVVEEEAVEKEDCVEEVERDGDNNDSSSSGDWTSESKDENSDDDDDDESDKDNEEWLVG